MSVAIPLRRAFLRAAIVALPFALTLSCRPAADPTSEGPKTPVAKEDLRAGPNVIGVNCDVGECQASCIAGSTILLAYGFHGRTYDSAGPVSSKCGEGVEWLGGCIGKESCSVTTACSTSAMYLICR